MLYALLLLPVLAGIAYVLLRRRRTAVPVPEPAAVPEAPVTRESEEPLPASVVVREAVPGPAAQISGEADPLQALETLLAELERATLDERDVEELERLAEQLEATARELERVP